ncbi:MAG: HD domain-containing protein [Candidatus Eremiobacteraeota bacterium]|nr:HD domain-containing protein [Candidatus Eremiobacteraeota bacterium]
MAPIVRILQITTVLAFVAALVLMIKKILPAEILVYAGLFLALVYIIVIPSMMETEFRKKLRIGKKNDEEAPLEMTVSAVKDKQIESSGISWQVPKTLEEAYSIIRSQGEERKKIQEAYQQERQKNNTIRHIAHDIATQKELQALYQDIVSKTRLEINSQAAFLMRLENNFLKVKHYDGILTEITMKVFEMSELFYEVVTRGTPIRLGKDNQDKLMTALAGTHEKIKNLICVPLKTHNDPKPFGLIGLANFVMGTDYTEDMEEFLSLISIEVAISIKNIEYIEQVERSYDETILGLAQALEGRDEYTHGHVERVREFSENLAIAMALTEDQVKIIKKAATLHDVGKIATPDSILRKDKALEPDEWAIMKDHTNASVRILTGIGSLEKEVLDLVLHHHERWDGKGYPHGLKGEAIPLGAQIIGVADTYDAMTSDRPYRKGMSPEVALKKMKDECIGTQFEPKVIDAFLKMMSRKLAKQKVELEMSMSDLSYVGGPQNPEKAAQKAPKVLDINSIKGME